MCRNQHLIKRALSDRVEQGRTGSLDSGPYRGGLVGRQVVHHDVAAGGERGHQHLLDIGEEGRAVHRTIEHHRRGHARQPERADEGLGLPVPVRHRRAAAFAARRPASQARHLGRGAGLVDEDQAFGIKLGLLGEPGFAPGGDVGPRLLAGVRGFF